MIRNKNIHKKFCTVMISLGLFFSLGQLAYAHNRDIADAEAIVSVSPTIENYKRLHALYKYQVCKYASLGKYDKAITLKSKDSGIKDVALSEAYCAMKKAEAAEKTANQLGSASDWENAAILWNQAANWYAVAELPEAINNNKKRVYSAKCHAISATYIHLINQQNEMSPIELSNKYESLINEWNNIAKLAESVEYDRLSSCYEITDVEQPAKYSELARAQIVLLQSKFMSEIANKTPECKDAEVAVASIPTIENLTLLRSLYQQNTNNHLSQEHLTETDTSKANEDKINDIMLANAHNAMAMAEAVEKTADQLCSANDWENASIFWYRAANWYTACKDDSSSKNSKKRADLTRYYAISAKLHMTYTHLMSLQNIMSLTELLNNYDNLINSWNNIIKLAQESNLFQLLAFGKIVNKNTAQYASEARKQLNRLTSLQSKSMSEKENDSPECTVSEIMAKKDPTIKNLEPLHALYLQNTSKHLPLENHTETEIPQTQKLTIKDTIKMNIQNTMAMAKRVEDSAIKFDSACDWEKSEMLWNQAATLRYKAARLSDTSQYTITAAENKIGEYSAQYHAISARINATFTKLCTWQTKMSPTEQLNNYYYLINRWNNIIKLAQESEFYQLSSFGKIIDKKPSEYIEKANICIELLRLENLIDKANKNKTTECDTEVEKYKNKIFNQAILSPQNESLLTHLLNARAEGFSSLVDENKSAENYGKLAQYWDDVVKFNKLKSKDSKSLLPSARAAEARAKQMEMLVENNKTPDNYKKLAKAWDYTANLYSAIKDLPQQPIACAKARIKAAEAKINKKDMKYNCKSHKYYKNLARYWYDIAISYNLLVSKAPLEVTLYPIKTSQINTLAKRAHLCLSKAKQQAEVAKAATTWKVSKESDWNKAIDLYTDAVKVFESSIDKPRFTNQARIHANKSLYSAHAIYAKLMAADIWEEAK